MTVSSTLATNLSSSDQIGKRLQQINETLSSISAKEVLFIITLSFIAILVALILCLQLLERSKKKKQISVPSSIVIQPNHVKSEKNGKSKNMSSRCENDVLPSKSMKMKVAITPSMTSIKKPRVASKEIVLEETKTEMSSKADSSKATASTSVSEKVEKVEKKEKAAPAPVEPDVTTAVEPVKPAAGDALATASSAPVKPAIVSQSADSMTSFTVPEDPSLASMFPKASAPPPATPTATTLSGISTTSSVPAGNPSMATAKDVTIVTAKSPAPTAPTAPVAPLEALAAPPVSPIIATTPPLPTSEKKI